MVTALLAANVHGPLAAVAGEAAAEELPPEARAAALLALLALALAGVLLLACAVIAARWIRRRVRDDGSSGSRSPAPTRPDTRHDRRSFRRRAMPGRTDETFHGGTDADTRAGS